MMFNEKDTFIGGLSWDNFLSRLVFAELLSVSIHLSLSQ